MLVAAVIITYCLFACSVNWRLQQGSKKLVKMFEEKEKSVLEWLITGFLELLINSEDAGLINRTVT